MAEKKRHEYPWKAIADDFIKGERYPDGSIVYPTLSELCRKYGPTYNQARRVMSDQRWLDRREQWQISLGNQVRDLAIEDYMKSASHFDASCLEAAQSGVDNILGYFRQAEAEQKLVGEVALDRLGRAFLAYQKAGRLVLGLTTENNGKQAQTGVQPLEEEVDLSLLSEKELELAEIIAQRLEERQPKKAPPPAPIPLHGRKRSA